MDFNFSDVEASWRDKADGLGSELAPDAAAADVVMGAARAGLIDPDAGLLAEAVAVDALARHSLPAAIVLALHTAALHAVAGGARADALARGETVGAITLATDEVPALDQERLTGRASWIAPVTQQGVVIVAGREGEAPRACATPLAGAGVVVDTVRTAALRGIVFGHVTFSQAAVETLGATVPIMARVRVLLAAAGLGTGRRAVREALDRVRVDDGRPRGAAGEQTVQGLLADAATELDAAMLLTWKAASAETLSLAEASMAKLAATEAAQGAVARATQVVGAASFTHGHVLERLTQDVRALELFAGRTEALREAVADETLPHA